MIQSLRDLTASLRDMKNYVNEIFTRSYNIEQKLAGGAPVQTNNNNNQPAVAAGIDAHTRQYLENIQNEVRQIRASQQQGQPLGGGGGYNTGGSQALCPDPNCTTSTVFLTVVLIQSGIIIAFIFLR